MTNIEAEIKDAIDEADAITEPIGRKTKLLRIADELPKAEEFTKLRVLAMRLALDIADTPRHKKASLEEIAKELPKSSDISFYRNYTLLGIAGKLPRTGEFISLYKEAIQRALDAVDVIQEPYYREYALLYIAKELSKAEGFNALYRRVVEEAFRAAALMQDPFAKTHALIELLQEIPKKPEFFTLLQEILKQSLLFYAAKNIFKNIDMAARLDYLIAGEQRRLSESKKTRYTKERYAGILARELEQIGLKLNDIRLIETIRPYTHIWIQPAAIRISAIKMADYLENLKNTYHGREIERPVFVSGRHPAAGYFPDMHKKAAPQAVISIDLGATNTVIMKRAGDAAPEYVRLDSITKSYAGTYVIPSILNLDEEIIGMEAAEKPHVVNFKKMLLDGNPKGKEYMERYLRLLHKRLKQRMSGDRRFSFFQNRSSEILYVAVPVGFHGYRRELKKIIEKIMNETTVEFIEEPLAAAIGYQAAEERDKVIMLIDFGGCTLNTMIVRLNINEAHVIAKPDRAKVLGGHDIDAWLGEYLSKKIGLSHDDKRYNLLIDRAEEIKIALSTEPVQPFEWNGKEICNVSREDFEKVLSEHDFYKTVDRSVSYILKKAEKVGVRKDMLEAVLLTGGSSQIPSFKEKIFHLFPGLREKNAVYDHSPFSAVARGAALYPRSAVTDRHLGMAYALRYITKAQETAYSPLAKGVGWLSYSYKLIFESGEHLPFEKTFRITAAGMLGAPSEIYLELFEVPEGAIERRWTAESGMEFIKQEVKPMRNAVLKNLNIITLAFDEPLYGNIEATFYVNEKGYLKIRYGKENRELETGIRLQ